MKILLAVDGSKSSLDAVDSLVAHAGWYREKPQVELVNVQLPVPKLPNMGSVVSKGQIQKFYDEEGAACLAGAQKKLSAAGLRYESRVLVGPVAETLVQHAKESGCELVVIGTRGMSTLGKAFLGSTADKVLRLSETPVLLVK